MARIKVPDFLNLKGFFDIRNVIPVLDKVQRGKYSRTIDGSIIRMVSEFIHANYVGVYGVEIYGGYNTLETKSLSGSDRTEIYYNNLLSKGFIARRKTLPTYDHHNPKLVLIMMNLHVFTDFPLTMKYYKSFSTDEITGHTYISLL
jgi:hypothetical protein